ncbi:calcium-binding mitochondrial carrier protein SCaMC-2-like isoform X3 [Tubulanus polymorphus]|uniref:calcium-binding mitochondrial carrier protein SCaMC-2-like isoform X3 n=1 Tax=Tubulanus polymorphus TaxID=672921 RepID=UPI003DA32FE2
MTGENDVHKLGEAALHHINPEEETRLQKLFDKLDVNKDGRIDVNDLSKAFEDMGVPTYPGQAQNIVTKSDLNKDGHLDFGEFVHYVLQHEKQLKLVFSNLDINKDGHLDPHEIMQSLRKLGIRIDLSEAEKLMKKMDKDGNLTIEFDEWRDFLLLAPNSLKDIVQFWKHSTIIDIGENSVVPDDFTQEEIQSGMWWRSLVAGGSAGAVSRTCTAPLDRLKVLLQVHASKKNQLGIYSGFKSMLREGGVKSLWRGNGVNVIKIAPESAMKFMAYEQVKRLFRGDDNRDLQLYERFLSGSMAGAISQTIIYPMEVLKTRLALRKSGEYTGMFDCAKKIYKKDGLRVFYRGYIPNIIGIIPYAGIDLAIYETLKNYYIAKHPDNADPGVMVLLACGTTSSTCGQLASYPLALVRTKLQAKVDSKASFVSLIKTIVKEEGPFGLYRGLAPNFLKVAPAVSISYVIYEHVRKLLSSNIT